MSRRTPETLVDWLVVGIAPFLIMLLVGSLVFYLAEVFYLGEYQLRLLFVLGLFVMAIVCIARISMEEGAAYASLYAVPLAGVVGLALATFVEVRGPLAALGPALNCILMAIVWWSAHKLTWDCTLIEGGRDFTGQGLMQTTGLDRFFRVKLPEQTESAPVEPSPPQPELTGTSQTTPSDKPLLVWRWWLQRDKRPHAPGVWVVYFSLAALPLFGLGQWFMPAGDMSLRRRAFWLLVVYVAAGLSLLMSTSFLSLRRYLRQRKLEMPNEMAGVWLGTGAVMVVILLILASLLPRPIPEYSITHLAPDIKAPSLNSSSWGWGPEGGKPKPGASQTGTKGEPAKNSQQSSSQSHSTETSQQPVDRNGSGQNSGSNSQSGSSGSSQNSQQQSSSSSESSEQNQSNSSAQNRSGQSQSEQNQSGPSGSQQNQEGQQGQSGQPSQPNNPSAEAQPTDGSGTRPLPNEASPPPVTQQSISQAIGQFFAYLMHALKWLFYLIVAAIIAYYVWKYREPLLVAWQQLAKELRELWARWFGQKQSAVPATAAPAPPPAKKFADYPDPFISGLAARWSLAELVSYTFAALEARGRERNCPRGEEQTPLEYAAAVGAVEPAFAGEFRSLADLYGQIAFAGGQAPPQAKSLVQQLWQRWKNG